MSTQIYLGLPPPNVVKWIQENYKPATPNYLCFTADRVNSTIKMIKLSSAPTVYLETSPTGEEGSWTDFIVDSTTINLPNVGDKVYFRAKQDNQRFGTNTYACNYFEMTGKIAASGNLNTLLKADGSVLDLSGRDGCYYGMFQGCSSLIQAPELPATTLAESCYCSMFMDCTSLTQAPALPATTLTKACYDSMFQGCSSLTQVPELPATTLTYRCYGNMFTGCSSLYRTPELPAMELAESCYENMFLSCTSLYQAPELPATELAYSCYSFMFNTCTSLIQAPELPATSLADNCYQGMFQYCLSLTQAPELPATSLTEYCYDSMFNSCNSPFTFTDKTFDEVANLIQEYYLIGSYYWHYIDEEYNEVIFNPIEIICSDATMLATFDENDWSWTLEMI